MNLPLFSLKLAGIGTVGAVADMPWAEFPLRDVYSSGSAGDYSSVSDTDGGCVPALWISL